MPTLCTFFSLNWICGSLIHSLKHGLVKRPKWYIRFHNTFLSTVLVTFVIGARIPLKYYFKIWTQSSWIQWIENFNEQHWTCWLLCPLYKYSRPWEIHRSYITDKGLSLFFPLPSKSNGTCKSLVPSIMATLSHLRPWFWERQNETVFGNLHKISDLISEKKSRGSVLGPSGHHLFTTTSAVCNEIYTDSIIKALFYNVGKSIS